MSDQPPEQPVQFTEWLENLRVDVAESLNGVILRGARYVTVGTAGLGTGATQKPASAPGSLAGFAFRNLDLTSGVNTHVIIRDGKNGETILTVALVNGESARDWFGPGGISFQHGLWLDFVREDAGVAAVEGSVFLRGDA